MMKVFTKKIELTNYLFEIKNKSLGLVPTMGNLHLGHLSLLNQSVLENDVSVITIFVNPTQFGPNEDFNKYPRTLDQDLNLIESIALKLNDSKEIIVFGPESIAEIYPDGFSTSISVGEIKTILCGKFRPTHFDGVTTVVYKLFQIINPKKAYFGQKDYQQCVVIKKMVKDLEIKIHIKVMPIIRNHDGLALSSRNQYLSDKEKEEGLKLYKSINKIKELILENKNYQSFLSECLTDTRFDYLEVLNADDLTAPSKETKILVIVGAFRIGSTRLLDNMLIDRNIENNHA